MNYRSIIVIHSKCSPSNCFLVCYLISYWYWFVQHEYNYNNIDAKAVLSVSGMTCAACVNTIENYLKGVNGITNAAVALLAEKAEVSYDSSLIKVFDSIYLSIY